jgi:hypothetical protein
MPDRKSINLRARNMGQRHAREGRTLMQVDTRSTILTRTCGLDVGLSYVVGFLTTPGARERVETEVSAAWPTVAEALGTDEEAWCADLDWQGV